MHCVAVVTVQCRDINNITVLYYDTSCKVCSTSEYTFGPGAIVLFDGGIEGGEGGEGGGWVARQATRLFDRGRPGSPPF